MNLVITRKSRQAAGAGTWVRGKVNGHRFEALVFPEHAENPAWELAGSRISKLWVERLPGRHVVFSWDRGLDLSPSDEAARQVVDLLKERLADAVFPQQRDAAPAAPVNPLAVPAPVFATARAAIAHARDAGGTAILLDAQHLVVPQQEAERLQAVGVSFAYLFEHGGRIMTVPVND